MQGSQSACSRFPSIGDHNAKALGWSGEQEMGRAKQQRKIRQDQPAYAEASAFVTTSARQVGEASRINEIFGFCILTNSNPDYSVNPVEEKTNVHAPSKTH